MTQEEHIKYWFSMADYDLKVAKDLLSNQHYLSVCFLSHQSVEKALKGYWCKTKDLTPLKIHTLSKLAQLSGLWDKMDEEQKEFLSKLEPLNISCRYPDY